MKTKEELNAIKKEVEALNKKLAELSEEELAQVFGGVGRPAISFELGGKPLVVEPPVSTNTPINPQ